VDTDHDGPLTLDLHLHDRALGAVVVEQDVDPVTGHEAVLHVRLSDGAEAEKPRTLRHVLLEQTRNEPLRPPGYQPRR